MVEHVWMTHPGVVGDAYVPRTAVKQFSRSGWRLRDGGEVERSTADAKTVAEVLADVGDDPARASSALAVERASRNRSTLVAQLESIANPNPGVGAGTES